MNIHNTESTKHKVIESPMQKRRVNKGVYDGLPVTVSDKVALNPKARSRMEKRAKPPHSMNDLKSCMISVLLFIIFMAMLGFILTANFDYVSHHPVTTMLSTQNRNTAQYPLGGGTLSKFASLQYALENSEIVGIYFAASWCPMSTPVSNKIEDMFSSKSSPFLDRVLPPQDKSPDLTSKKDFALVYVSSDESEEDMREYARSNWISIPFDSSDKSNIKRHFKICASVEMESLGIERRNDEIPSLLIIDSLTHGLLSSNGKQDINEYGEGVLEHWIQLKHLVRSLNDKYADE